MIQSLLSVGRTLAEYETSLCVGSEHEKVLAPVGYHRPVYNLGRDSRAHTSISTIISGDGKYVGCQIVYKRVSATQQRRLPTFPRMASPVSGGARCPPRDTSTGRCFSRESWLTSWSTVRRRTFPNRCVYSVQFDKILLLSLLPTHDSDQ